LRKVLFALVLVGAAFAGGAAVNGPGLEQLKAAIRARLQSNSAPEVVAQSPTTPKEVPSAPPPLVPAFHDDRPSSRQAEAPSSAIEVASPPPKSEAAPPELAGPASSPSPVPAAEPRTPSDPAVEPASRQVGAAQDWGNLRRRMKDLGITRYEIEGDPSGRSRFRCLIPLAGRRAVGQQFEGEGDDDFQAADSALRRVALWRATEATSP
jgi:hypothetical protein